MGMIYSGQEVSLDKRLWFFNKDEIDWTGASRRDFFKTLIDLKHGNKALWNGQDGGVLRKIETDADDKVYAFIREKDGDTFVGIFNLSDQKVPVILRGSDAIGTYKNAFSLKKQTVTADMSLTLKPFEYILLTNV